MPALLSRRAFALIALAAVAVAPSACKKQPGGDLRVLVIGEKPSFRDPAQQPLSASDEVLMAEIAQGLVRFDAGGNIVSGLAERWNVSDDGRSYIFRIATAQWPDGRKITAHQVVRALKRQLASRSKNPLKDTLGVVEDVVAMTDRVIEIRLRAPRPNLLALLAQPEFAIQRSGQATGPFKLDTTPGAGGELRLFREVLSADGETTRRDEVLLGSAGARDAIVAFAKGQAHLVLGGTFVDLPYAQAVRVPRGSLRFDPASGLFGLVPTSAEGPFADPGVRRLLGQAIDREALVTALNVPGLAARATVLEPGLDGVTAVVQPAWFGTPMDQRRPLLASEASRILGAEKRPPIRIFLPEGPGAQRLLARLTADWGAIGFTVERAKSAGAADFRLVDEVAPSTSPAWFLRRFRCGAVPLCDPETDTLLSAARETQVSGQRSALLLQAAGRIDEQQLFMPLTAPIRWSLVSSRISGFAGNRYARHTLTDLQQPFSPGGS